MGRAWQISDLNLYIKTRAHGHTTLSAQVTDNANLTKLYVNGKQTTPFNHIHKNVRTPMPHTHPPTTQLPRYTKYMFLSLGKS